MTSKSNKHEYEVDEYLNPSASNRISTHLTRLLFHTKIKLPRNRCKIGKW